MGCITLESARQGTRGTVWLAHGSSAAGGGEPMYHGTMIPMTDREFLTALEHCELAPEAFTHAAHVRAGYLYLCAGGFDSALGRMRCAVKRYAAHLGKADKYHETITVAYLALIHQRLSEGGDAGDWMSFMERNPELLDRDLLLRHYSRSELGSDLARRIFILPLRAGRTAPTPGGRS